LTDADGNPITVLDEAALNEMVRALIREELQGALGERITHNVRKLVRAEINRALAARALD
jgi:cell pole-organizing protein PopZ